MSFETPRSARLLGVRSGGCSSIAKHTPLVLSLSKVCPEPVEGDRARPETPMSFETTRSARLLRMRSGERGSIAKGRSGAPRSDRCQTVKIGDSRRVRVAGRGSPALIGGPLTTTRLRARARLSLPLLLLDFLLRREPEFLASAIRPARAIPELVGSSGDPVFAAAHAPAPLPWLAFGRSSPDAASRAGQLRQPIDGRPAPGGLRRQSPSVGQKTRHETLDPTRRHDPSAGRWRGRGQGGASGVRYPCSRPSRELEFPASRS